MWEVFHVKLTTLWKLSAKEHVRIHESTCITTQNQNNQFGLFGSFQFAYLFTYSSICITIDAIDEIQNLKFEFEIDSAGFRRNETTETFNFSEKKSAT